jgi:hypothetical protein
MSGANPAEAGRRLLSFVIAMLMGGVVLVVAGCGGSGDATPAWTGTSVTTTAVGTVIARATDRERGLVFEVESSPSAEKTFLTVALTPGAPNATRNAVFHHVLAGHCPVPDEPMLTFFGRWDPRRRRFTTEIAPDDPRVVVARRATRCEMYVGRPGPTRETAVFPKRPFSRVRMR